MTFYRPDFIEEIRRDARDASDKKKNRAAQVAMLRQNPDHDLFRIKPADRWLADEYTKPAARQLLGSLWYEHELCILFADTNLGKSILAVQIGANLCKQAGIHPFGSQVDEALKVLYVDFELSTQQFKARYTDSITGSYHFGDNFYRAEFNPGGDDPLLYQKYEDYVREWIENGIKKTGAQVLIIDNITYMGSAANAANALPLIKGLKALKIKHNLSVLVLAHTPKRNNFKPITVNDLQGSKMLINFADSAFAIGQSQADPHLRYLKQVKQRNTASDYGADHVCLFRITKQQSFLGLEFVGFDHESIHLQQIGTGISNDVKQQVYQLHQQGLSHRQVAAHLKISHSTVSRLLSKLKEEGS
jgi:hypothetical protein